MDRSEDADADQSLQDQYCIPLSSERMTWEG